MTKLLDADWLMIFPKQTKWRKGILNIDVKCEMKLP
jgi:hypothetical protein